MNSRSGGSRLRAPSRRTSAASTEPESSSIRSGIRHRLAAVAPGLRDAHEPRRELPPAGVALVARAERDGSERAAIRTAGAETRHLRGHLLVPEVAPPDLHPDPLVQAHCTGRVV